MKVKIIIISILLLLLIVFTSGCIFLEKMGNITSPSLKVGESDGIVTYWAVIVGIEDYESMTDLSYTIDDAEDMRNVLLSYGNWDNSNIQFLTDVDANKSSIDTAIAYMASESDGDDVCLFFFSGHGSRIPDEKDGGDEVDFFDEVICPWDTTEELGNVISDDELGTWLSACPDNIVVILDTCMSGGFATKGAEGTIKTVPNPQVSKDAIVKKHFGEGLVERLKQSPISRDLNLAGYVVLMACEEDKSAYESRRLKNGVFTYYIVEGLWGPADTDNDNNVSAEEDFSYADPLVRQYKPTNQDPQLWDGDYAVDLMLVIALPPDAGTIAGNVTEAKEGSAIAGATVVVEGTNLSAITNANGDYTITDVAEGTYTVTASATGYIEESKTAEVLKDQTTGVDFALTPAPSIPVLCVNVNTDKNNYSLGESVSITVTVTENTESGQTVEGTSVHVEIITASNREYTKDGTTDSEGKVIFKFKTKKPDGKGTYSVAANASKSGYESGSGSTTFNVE